MFVYTLLIICGCSGRGRCDGPSGYHTHDVRKVHSRCDIENVMVDLVVDGKVILKWVLKNWTKCVAKIFVAEGRVK